MITRNDIVDALTMCVGFDPVHAPKQSEIITDAWMAHFALSPCAGLNRQHVLGAVSAYYATPQRPWPQPADISAAARAAIRDAMDRAPLEPASAPASAEVRTKCLAEIRAILGGKRTFGSMPV